MKKSELKQLIREEISNVKNEGRRPGPIEQRRREIMLLANKYLHNNHAKVQSYSFDKDTDTFHFYKGDWSIKDESPVISIPFNDLKNQS
jgi:hypothetical protein